jgi:hypothetical protein
MAWSAAGRTLGWDNRPLLAKATCALSHPMTGRQNALPVSTCKQVLYSRGNTLFHNSTISVSLIALLYK